MSKGAEDYIKRMSDALRSGARMLSETCPVCSSPLFSLSGELWCLKCNRRVVRVREETEATAATVPYILSSLNNTLTAKIEELNILLQREVDPEKIHKLTQTLDSLLRVLRESRRLEAESRKQEQ
ncbi:MAG: hypothetical protein NXY59_01610 [Aigarchaeota archaeon]|nr:hypothetical protein [Candidatus Pelearchaeum maunauluense]